MNLKLVIQLYQNMGLRYVLYRLKHELEKRMGLLKKRHPLRLQLREPISREAWKQSKSYFLQKSKFDIGYSLNHSHKLKETAERILGGELLFFNASWIQLPEKYNWLTNPSNNYQYDISKHWSEIPDLSEEAGDIKFVWEKSRFSYFLTLIRYDYHFKKDLSEFVFSEIESWIDANPINHGPNWRCSQEISIRIFNWYFALTYYKESSALTEIRWKKIQNVIYASLHHVYNHIDFSRIAVRNNHAITETLFLALSDVLFPFIPETKKWANNGKTWFEEEISYQIYEDGTFLQFSMNYHRVVVQLLTLGISTFEKAGRAVSKTVYERAYQSLDFLYQCTQDENGWLPNYGANDGALFFPWSDTDYRDYRPQLNSLHFLLTGKNLFMDLLFTEEKRWWNITDSLAHNFNVISKQSGLKEYPTGGYVIIRDGNSFTFIRCGNHKDRPSQADNLHVDIWVNGENVLRDSGTFKYNTSKDLLNYFTGSAAHNTVIVDGQSQMLKGSRFIWYYWSQKINTKLVDINGEYVFEGTIKAFNFLNINATHYRKVRKIKGRLEWVIFDRVLNLNEYEKEQVWHCDNHPIRFLASENQIELEKRRTVSYKSDYYGLKENGEAIAYLFNESIETIIEVEE